MADRVVFDIIGNKAYVNWGAMLTFDTPNVNDPSVCMPYSTRDNVYSDNTGCCVSKGDNEEDHPTYGYATPTVDVSACADKTTIPNCFSVEMIAKLYTGCPDIVFTTDNIVVSSSDACTYTTIIGY